MAQVKRVIIDADPGIDDTAAILMALASERLEVEAITTVFGNASVEQCTVNTLRILEAAGRRGHSRVPRGGEDADVSRAVLLAAYSWG